MKNRHYIACVLLLSAAAWSQTGKCHSAANNGASCANDSDCIGGASPYCAVLKHIFIVVKDDRSFDHEFGSFTNACGPGTCDAPTTVADCKVSGGGGCSTGKYDLVTADASIAGADCGHTHGQFPVQYDNGLMDGFNQTCYGSLDWGTQQNATTMPHYWTYASEFGLADRMFASTTGGAYPNRMFTIAATSSQVVDTPGLTGGSGSCQLNPSTACTVDRQCPAGDHCSTGGPTSCTARHQGLCSEDNTRRCYANADCGGTGGSCVVDQPTGHCLLSPATSCTYDSTCNALHAGDTCSNQNLYSKGALGVLAIDPSSGASYSPGVCTADNKVACTSLAGDTSCSRYSPTTCDTTHYLAGAKASPCPNVLTIFDLLDAAGRSWKFYAPATAGQQHRNALDAVQHIRYGTEWATNYIPITISYTNPAAADQFTTDVCASGYVQGVTPCTSCTSDATCSSVPAVSYLSPSAYAEDGNSIASQGELWTYTHLAAIQANSYLWNHSVVLLTWSNSGGYYDHFEPTESKGQFGLGFRVPLLCIGPYCKNRITTTTYTDESLLSCIEHNFGTGNLGLGDVTANNPCENSAASMVDLTLHGSGLK